MTRGAKTRLSVPTSSTSAERIVPEIIRLVSPRSVIDLGCGDGEWLAEFEKHDISDVLGVEAEEMDRSGLVIDPRRFRPHDLRSPFSLDRTFDLAISLEVAEHLPPQRAQGFVADLVALAPVVLFSAAIPNQGGVGHVNEQWPDYWCGLFRQHDYRPLDCLRLLFWNDTRIAYFYRQNLLLYASGKWIDFEAKLPAFGNIPSEEVLRLIHPDRPEPNCRAALQLFIRALRRRFVG